MIDITIKKLTESEVEISGEISAEEFESFRNEVMKDFRAEMELPGFRKGHAPDNLIIGKLGDEKILYEMAEKALAHNYPEILKEKKIDAIGQPEIAITKIAKNNPLGFTIKTATMPEFKLADYKKIAKTENTKPAESLEVTDKEIADVIEEIRKNRGSHEKHEHKEGEKCEEKIDLPELNDEFAKSLGQFESVTDLKNKIKENLTGDKTRRAKDKKRLEIMEEIIAQTKIDLPKILVEGELNKLSHEMRHQLESMGLKYEDYLSHLKKTEEDLRKEWEPEAIKRGKFGLILAAVAEQEKIAADVKELDSETSHILEQYKDADPARVRAYAENMIINENVFKFLEKLK
jgi:FKBP-type peptidyl-prolyl cis-trans isomerase (trigger factor)